MKLERVGECRVRSAGFSLIELSIVMVILGVMTTMMVGFFEPSIDQVRKAKNQVIVQNAVNALVAQAGAYKKLPATLTGYADAKSNTLQYSAFAGLTDSNGVCNLSTTGWSVTDATGGFTVNDVAFLVWSVGANGVAELGAGATSVPVESSTFDDVAGWATLWELKAAAGCEGRTMRIVSTSVPAGTSGSLYSTATFTPDGGSANYSWCVEFPAVITGGVLSDNLGFTSGVPVGDTDSCAGASWGASATLTMTGTAAFSASGDAGSYDFKVFLRDSSSSPNTDSRVFTLYVK
ncbi:MAG: type II secretion system protein [Magnetococcales bacterium]|nr:type II secretion system protein [Magnetococcales bacterium]